MTHLFIQNWARKLFTLVALLPTAGALGAGWNEAVDGDLSGDYQNPTVISLAPGVNTIRATSGTTTTMDLEYFRVDLPTQGQIDAIFLRAFESPSDGTAFIAVQPGTSFTFPASDVYDHIDAMLGHSHFGLYDGGINGDLLPLIGAGFGAIGFTGPLTGPSYTFWSQQQGQATTYELEFVVSAVPEPATLTGAFAALLFGACGRRRS